MSTFAVLIKTPSESLILDAVDDFEINSENELTSHPLPNGQLVADHTIIKPCSGSVSGTFGMHASTPIKSLAEIQQKFESIKNNGTLCTIAKFKIDGKQFRFMKRQNMCLTGIRWTEQIDTLDYSFSFRQVLIGNVIEKTVSKASSLPDVVAPSVASPIGSIISEQELFNVINQVMYASGFATKEFYEQINSAATIAGIAGLAVTGGAAVTAILSAAASALGMSAIGGPTIVIGAIVASAIILIGLIVSSIYAYIEKVKLDRSFKYARFEAYSDPQKQQEENKRYLAVMQRVYNEVAQINSWVKMYELEFKAQECMINVGGSYCNFRFTRNNNSNKLNCQIYSIDESINYKSKPITLFDSTDVCTENNYFAKIAAPDQTVWYIHFLYGSKRFSDNMSVYEKQQALFGKAYTEKIEPESFYILVSKVTPNRFSEEIAKLITNSIMR